ncbi:MAG: glucose-6-phosphate dehydrogenase [Clostridiales bacterium]|nr:glucose-6-phosphate dehydrogenase [Clostridiales bacterium]
MNISNENAIFVIFGGTGDLTKRKLIPALYNLEIEKKLSEKFIIVAIGRRDYTTEFYRKQMKEAIIEFSGDTFNEKDWNKFVIKISYLRFDFSHTCEGYTILDKYLSKIDKENGINGNRIYYLAVPPSSFEPIINNLHCRKMLLNKDNWQRVMVEKPFGSNLKSARELNENISKSIKEKNLFRIDHYLGKEMIQNIMAIRFGNSIFEPLWNHQYIENIQIISSETIGVKSRGSYYEATGVLKDMLQNHILQMLSLIAMEPPISLLPEEIRDEKVKAIKSLRIDHGEKVEDTIVLGQYGESPSHIGYRDEDNVNSKSKVPTFIAMKAYIDNFRWSGVPFYIKVGKGLPEKETKIIIQFKKLPGINHYEEFNNTKPNMLVIRIQPNEGIYFQINAKTPGNEFKVNSVEMDYCQKSAISSNSTAAYERLIIEAIRNNSSLFTRWDELEYSWKYIESIEQAIKSYNYQYPNYVFGTEGPTMADKLLESNHKWYKS